MTTTRTLLTLWANLCGHSDPDAPGVAWRIYEPPRSVIAAYVMAQPQDIYICTIHLAHCGRIFVTRDGSPRATACDTPEEAASAVFRIARRLRPNPFRRRVLPRLA